MTDQTKPGTIERTIALSEIRFTLGSYATRARETTELESFLENLTSSAHITTPDGTRMPFRDFFEMVTSMNDGYLRHDVSSVEISFVGNRRAKTVSHVTARTDKSQADHWGEWRNVLVEDVESGRWLIEEQVNVVDGFHPDGFYAAILKKAKGE